ncbi:hypothetical protein GQX74_006655 [Glossina fuscipes]|nr:hypothetical protein GQX74_006655 [Glossina fuscipes]
MKISVVVEKKDDEYMYIEMKKRNRYTLSFCISKIDWFCFDCLIDIRKRSMKPCHYLRVVEVLRTDFQLLIFQSHHHHLPQNFQEMESIVKSYPMRRVGRNRLKVERLEVIAAGFGLGPSRAGALRKSGTGCCISVVKRIVGCSTIRGLMSSCISVFAVFRRGNVADLSVIDAVDVFTPPAPPSLLLVFWDAEDEDSKKRNKRSIVGINYC